MTTILHDTWAFSTRNGLGTRQPFNTKSTPWLIKAALPDWILYMEEKEFVKLQDLKYVKPFDIDGKAVSEVNITITGGGSSVSFNNAGGSTY